MNNKISLIEAFNNAADRFPNNKAVVEDQKTYSFLELKQLSDKLAAGLEQKGIVKGDRIALYCVNSVQFAIAYMGIVKAGAVVVPINLLQKAEEISFVLSDAAISGLIYHDAFDSTVEILLQKIKPLVVNFCISDDPSKSTAWDQALITLGSTPDIDIAADDDLVAILYTSGTTGRPKGAMLTHSNLVANTRSVFKAMQWVPGAEVITLVLPMFHAFAATVGMLTPLTHGCCFLPIPKFEPDNLLKAIQQSQATVFLAVPSMYNILLNTKADKTSRFNSIKLCISGGASMPVGVLNSFEEKFGVAIYEGDGPTECSPVTCVNPIGGVRKVGTVGLPVPNVEMTILDETGVPLKTGEIGEIAVRGPNVMKGYWHLPEETANSFIGEWFLTGDLGNVDEDGYFSILDRKKDMVIVNGMNVYPRIIEELLYRFEPILEAAVIGIKDPLHGEIPVAYVALKKNETADASSIRRWCREHLASYEVPRKVIFMDELPKNAAGKIVKRVLSKTGEIERGIQHD